MLNFDDPWGISWRVKNQVTRFNMRRFFRFLRGYIQTHNRIRPVFILGAARSGTTMLFQVLNRSSELGSLPREGHDMWRMYHHPRYTNWDSDSVGSGQIKLGERRFINAFLYAYFVQSRFIEKTPENCLRIPYLLDLFPDAHFIIIKRNPCDVISSLINGWREPTARFRSYYVPVDLKIPSYPHRRLWRFALIKDWRNYISSPVSEIAFEQWRQCIEGLMAGSSSVPANRWTEVYLENLLEKPDKELQRIISAIGIQPEPILFRRLHELVVNPVNALSPAGKSKWRNENEADINTLLPQIIPLAEKTGYLLDPKTGECTIKRNCND